MERFKVRMLPDAVDFVKSLPPKASEKIQYNLLRASMGIDRELLKKLKGSDIWEFRTLYNSEAYRLLAFWDKTENALIIATHGFKKKTQKTPKSEIDRAEALMNEYYNNK